MTTCRKCGKAMTALDNKGRGRLYCSRECVGRDVGSDGEARNKNAKRTITCLWCGKEEQTYYKTKKYCSSACANAGRNASGSRRVRGAKDANHDEVVAGLRSLGYHVADTHHVGGGFPDVIVGVVGIPFVWMFEIKNPNTAYGRSGLNKVQQRFLAGWDGGLHVIYSRDDAAKIIERDRQRFIDYAT